MGQFKQVYKFGVINQDLAPDKRPSTMFFDVVNMEVYFTDRGMSAVVAKGTGNPANITVPPPDGGDPPTSTPADFAVLGEGYINHRLFIFVTQRTGSIPLGHDPDGIFEVTQVGATVSVTLIQSSDFDFNTDNPITAVGYKETDGVSKLYWVDGLNQYRNINVDAPTESVDNVITLSTSGLIAAVQGNLVGSIDMVVRYGFSLYNIGGRASKLSALTTPYTISEQAGSVQVTCSDLPTQYNNIRVYRVTYKAANANPTIDLVWDGAYTAGVSIVFEDTGRAYISDIAVEDFFNLGSDYVVPDSIVSKKQHILLGNIVDEPLYIDPTLWDARAYGFQSYDEVVLADVDGTTNTYTAASIYAVPVDSDCINIQYDAYKHQADFTTLGVEGVNIKVECVDAGNAAQRKGKRLFKQGEVYRVGIQGQDDLLRWSNVLWVSDIKIPYIGAGATLEGTVMNGFNSILYPDAPNIIKWKFVIVERQEKDKTVLMQVVPQPVMTHLDGFPTGNDTGSYPFPFMKTMRDYGEITFDHPFPIDKPYHGYPATSLGTGEVLDFALHRNDRGFTIQIKYQDLAVMLTPDVVRLQQDLSGVRGRILGHINLDHDSSYIQVTNSYDSTKSSSIISFGDAIPQTRPRDILAETENVPYCIFDVFHDGSVPHENKVRITYMYTRSNSGNINYVDNGLYLTEQEIDDFKYLGIDSAAVCKGKVVTNVATIAPFFSAFSNNDRTHLGLEGQAKFAAGFANLDWHHHPVFLNGYGAFGFPSGDQEALPVMDIVVDNPSQYNGPSYEAKSANIYIDASEPVALGVAARMYADTFVGVYSFAYSTAARTNLTNQYTNIYDYVYIQMESAVDPEEFNTQMTTEPITTEPIYDNYKALEVKHFLDYDLLFSTFPNLNLSAGVPFNAIRIVDYRTRIIPTAIKHPGEVIDSWTEILSDTFLDLEGVYGEITSLVKVGDNVLAFQPKGVASIKVYPTAQTTSTSGSVQLGKGKVLDEYDYIVTNVGALNKEAIRVVDSMVFFIDSFNRTINELKDGELSPILGFNTLLKTIKQGRVFLNNDVDALFVAVNKSKDEVYFKLSSAANVLVYNYKVKAFTHTRTYAAQRFIGFEDRVFVVKDGYMSETNQGAIRSYFGVNQDASLTLWAEPLPGADKVFDAVSIHKTGEDTQFDEILVESPTRTSGLQTIDVASKYDIHTVFLPPVQNSRDRWRVKNIKLKLIYKGVVDFAVDMLKLKFSGKKL